MTGTIRTSTLAQIAALSATIVLAVVGCTPLPDDHKKKSSRDDDTKIEATAFPDLNGKEPYNTSGAVPIADSKFLLVDNNMNDALLELTLNKDGTQSGPLVRRPIIGLGEDGFDDAEDITLVTETGRRFVVAAPSLSVQTGSKRKGRDDKVRPGGLVRVAIGDDGSLTGEDMPDFRTWLIAQVPELLIASDNDPDRGGLNIEGLAWDAGRHALLLGVRTPVSSRQPIVVPIKVKDIAGPWTTANVEVFSPIHLKLEREAGEQGIRGLAPNPYGGGFLVLVGNSTSESSAPFSLYVWEGDDRGTSRRLPFEFQKKMKPEGVSAGTIGGREAILILDDGGGFAVIWRDEAGL